MVPEVSGSNPLPRSAFVPLFRNPRSETQRRNAMKRAARKRQAELNRMAKTERLVQQWIEQPQSWKSPKSSVDHKVSSGRIHLNFLETRKPIGFKSSPSELRTPRAGRDTGRSDPDLEYLNIFADVYGKFDSWRSARANSKPSPRQRRHASGVDKSSKPTTQPSEDIPRSTLEGVRALMDQENQVELRIRSRTRKIHVPRRTQFATGPRVLRGRAGMRMSARLARSFETLVEMISDVAMYVEGTYITRWGHLRVLNTAFADVFSDPVDGLPLAVATLCFVIWQDIGKGRQFVVPLILDGIFDHELIGLFRRQLGIDYASIALAWGRAEGNALFQDMLESIERVGVKAIWLPLMVLVRASIRHKIRPALESMLEIVSAFVPVVGLVTDIVDTARATYSLFGVVITRYTVHQELSSLRGADGTVRPLANARLSLVKLGRRVQRLFEKQPRSQSGPDFDPLTLNRILSIHARVFKEQLSSTLRSAELEKVEWDNPDLLWIKDLLMAKTSTKVSWLPDAAALADPTSIGASAVIEVVASSAPKVDSRIEEIPDYDANYQSWLVWMRANEPGMLARDYEWHARMQRYVPRGSFKSEHWKAPLTAAELRQFGGF